MMDFSKRYDRDEFMKFLQNEFLPEDVSFTTDPEAEKQEKTKYIKAITKLGTCPSLRLAVYEARHTSPNDARVGLSKEIFRFMGNKRERRALVLFVPKGNGANYRFSLISIDLHETEDGKIQHGYSNPRRYSYYLGEGVAHRTPDDYLKKRSRVKDADDLTSRFAVEILNKAFFDEYKDQYRKFCKFLNENPEMRRSFQDFSDDGKAIRDYVKKMLGRIVFLYFVQRKGWLDGNYRYMSDLFAHAAADVQSDFLDLVLEPMFFGLLNTPKAERIAHAEKNGWDFSLIPGWENIPYLNGGLFEQDEIDKCKSVFPKEYFAALFDFFDTYNFTIDENDPDDNEVGIDPEMLGHIFENLLEDNKDKGAFYTPKEIVQYMCRESVIQYLKTHEPDARYAEAIEHLIRNGEVDKELQDKAIAMQFTKWLSEVKVCDPAIGSGAFPMGVLNVLYHSRRLLYGFTKENTAFSPAEVKREIIQNNIYGVDIEQGAVDIARLRFWLSLVVDEDRPQPLPNLDYKIMQGNSLLESFMGYDLSRLLPVNKDGKTSKRATQPASANDTQARLVFGQEQNSIAEIQRLMRLYYSPENHEQKEQLKRQIDTLVKEHIVICGGNTPAVREAVDRIADNNKPFFLWHLYFADVFQKGGFDIVIGNPPYGVSITGNYRKTTSEYLGKVPDYEIYYYFIRIALQLLPNKGLLSYIIPNTYLFNTYAKDFRLQVLNDWTIIEILDCTKFPIFNSAIVRNTINIWQKGALKNGLVGYRNTANTSSFTSLIAKRRVYIAQQDLLNMNQNWGLAFYLPQNYIYIINKIAICKNTISTLFPDISQGLIAYDKYRGQNIETIRNRSFHYSTYKDGLKQWLWGEDVKRYSVKWNGREYIDYCKDIANPRHPKFFSGKRILIREITNPTIYAALTEEELYNDPAIIIVKDNSAYSIEVVLGILNSKLATFYHFNHSPKATKGVFPKILVQDIKNFPLPEISMHDKKIIEEQVQMILHIKQKNPNANTNAREQLIDRLVYQLYGLTYDEVKIIDPATPITREEYEYQIKN